MSKGDSSKEEGEISDEDDVFTENGKFEADGDGLHLPVPKANHIPSYAGKFGTTKKVRQRRRRNIRNNTYGKRKNQAGKVLDDYHMMISEYKNIRRIAEFQNSDEPDENKNFSKSSGNYQQFIESDDLELMLLRKSALESDKRNHTDGIINDRDNIGDTFNRGNRDNSFLMPQYLPDANLVDNYEVVHMEVESDKDDSTTGISADITMLEEHISQLKQKKMEITECQKQLKQHQSMLSELAPMKCDVPNLTLMNHSQQPFYPIIQHNLLSSSSHVRPLMPLNCSLPLKMPQMTRSPLLPDPMLRRSLLPKPGLLPPPRSYPPCNPLLMSEFANHRHQFMPRKPSMELPMKNMNFSQTRLKVHQNITPWNDQASFSPRQIEVVSGTCRRDSKDHSSANISPSLNCHFSSSSSSLTSLSSTSKGEGRTSQRMDCPGLNFNEKKKDPLYEDFDDELHVSKCNRPAMKQPPPISLTANITPVPTSWVQSFPHYEGLDQPIVTSSSSCFKQIDVDFQEVKVENMEETKEDDNYINILKTKLLQDIELKKNKKVLEMNAEESNECSKINSGRAVAVAKHAFNNNNNNNGDEEDFGDMIVIDSDHEHSPPAATLSKTPIDTRTHPEKPSEPTLECTSSDASDGAKDEELILRARLLQSLAARQIKQASSQLEQPVPIWDCGSDKKQEEEDVDESPIESEPPCISEAVEQACDILNSEENLQGEFLLLARKKKRNRKRRLKKNNIVKATASTLKPLQTLNAQIFSTSPLRKVTLPSKMASSPLSFMRDNKNLISPSFSSEHPAIDSFSTVQDCGPVFSSPRLQTLNCISSGSMPECRIPAVASIASMDQNKKLPGDSMAAAKVNASGLPGRNEAENQGAIKAPSRGLAKDGRTVRTGLSITTKYSKVPLKTKFPNCEPIVILLSGDESEESGSESKSREENSLDDNMSNKLESLLKEARKEMTFPNATSLSTDGTSLNSLESNDINKINATSNSLGICRKIQPAKKDKLENLNKEELRRREKELEVSLLNHKLNQLEKKSVMESISLKEQKNLLLKLESVLSKKRAELVISESNAQKIREQLEAVLKILNHNQLQVAELDKRREAMRSQILEKERKTLKTSNDITECHEKLLVVTKSLKSNLQLINSINKQHASTRLMSSNLKLKQQLKNKRKLSSDVNPEHVAKKPMVANSSPTANISASRDLKTSNVTQAFLEIVMDDKDHSMVNTTKNIEKIKDHQKDSGFTKAVSPLKLSKLLNSKSKTVTIKVNPLNAHDEKILKIKDAHRKSTLRNLQFVQTSTTRLVPPIFNSAIKLLNFGSGLIMTQNKSSLSNSGISNVFGESESGKDNFSKMDFLCSFLKSVRSFRTEKEFGNPTYTNKIENDVPLCQFEILGKCNDDECLWQHERNYLMSPREILMEIVSYYPYIVPELNEDTPLPKYKTLIGAYVDNFISKSKQTDIQKLYLMMLHLVSQAKGSAIFTPLHRNRLWSVKQEKVLGKGIGCKSNINIEDRIPFVLDMQLDEDDALSGFDHRYWMTKRQNDECKLADEGNMANEIQECDVGIKDDVMDNHQPQGSQSLDEETFLNKAYSILSAETKLKHSPKVDVVLKVLAKGIEHHPRSVLLWQHYLKIFTQLRNQTIKKLNSISMNASSKEATSESKEDQKLDADISTKLKQAFKQALKMVPSFELHWLHIQISESFSSKIESCSLALEYLCSDKVKNVEKNVRSHWLLEVIMHKAQICFQTGKYAMGMDLLEDCLNCRDVYGLLPKISTSDRIMIWMSFLHLSIFHSLPINLFSGVNDNVAMIVNKAPFSIFNHQLSVSAKQFSGTTSKNECVEMISWYDKAIESCLSYFFRPPSQGFLTFIKELENASCRGEQIQKNPLIYCNAELERDEEAWAWLARLFVSKAILLIEIKRNKDAIFFLQSVSNLLPEYVHDIRIVLLHIICNLITSSPNEVSLSKDFDEFSKYAHGCLSAKLTYHVAKLLISKDQSEEALQLLERLPIIIHGSDSGKEDPNILYCKLLDLELPMGFIPPCYSKDFKRDSLEKERMYFWLCYCLLLDLQGDYASAEDVYCKAICKTLNSTELGEIWLARLDRLLSSCDQAMSPEIQREFFRLINNSLRTLPVRLLLPLNEIGGKTYDSYDVHNSIISFCTQRMSSTESLTDFYDWTLSMMPGNAHLAVEAINHFIRYGHRPVAKGFVIMCLQEAPRSVALWKTSLKLALLEGNIEQVRADYKKSLENLPFQKKLWKDFMLFEMVNKGEDVNLIVERCQQLGVNILDLFKTLSSR